MGDAHFFMQQSFTYFHHISNVETSMILYIWALLSFLLLNTYSIFMKIHIVLYSLLSFLSILLFFFYYFSSRKARWKRDSGSAGSIKSQWTLRRPFSFRESQFQERVIVNVGTASHLRCGWVYNQYRSRNKVELCGVSELVWGQCLLCFNWSELVSKLYDVSKEFFRGVWVSEDKQWCINLI